MSRVVLTIAVIVVTVAYLSGDCYCFHCSYERRSVGRALRNRYG